MSTSTSMVRTAMGVAAECQTWMLGPGASCTAMKVMSTSTSTSTVKIATRAVAESHLPLQQLQRLVTQVTEVTRSATPLRKQLTG
mmetsp:Transcript_20632/g.48005  ORF Transcript_20632/g.48005 Transcript_20632/m.48005 type:complete len:85 (-) Transcript_20632:93-347(-)